MNVREINSHHTIEIQTWIIKQVKLGLIPFFIGEDPEVQRGLGIGLGWNLCCTDAMQLSS